MRLHPKDHTHNNHACGRFREEGGKKEKEKRKLKRRGKGKGETRKGGTYMYLNGQLMIQTAALVSIDTVHKYIFIYIHRKKRKGETVFVRREVIP